MTDALPKSSRFERLAALIEREREALLAAWRSQVRQFHSARHLDTPTLNDHIPGLLDELAAAFRSRSDETIAEALVDGSPPTHGLQRVKDAFDIEEVVSEYNVMRDCIHDLAEAHQINLQGEPFRILNRVLDGAIGSAVQAFAAQRALEVQQRREEYLSFVAHDLRTPLNAIAMSATVLGSSIPKEPVNPQALQMLAILNRNVQHITALVNKVVQENIHTESSGGLKMQRRAFDLWPPVQALILDLHPVSAASTTRVINRIPDDLSVYADADLLRRILQNLIANAVRYTPSGEVVIGARNTDDDGSVECMVADNGAGIPASLIAKVFDKLESDPNHEGGIGLGLAIVKTFVEAHGGAVTVESTEGTGSTFRFTLPGKQVSS